MAETIKDFVERLFNRLRDMIHALENYLHPGPQVELDEQQNERFVRYPVINPRINHPRQQINAQEPQALAAPPAPPALPALAALPAPLAPLLLQLLEAKYSKLHEKQISFEPTKSVQSRSVVDNQNPLRDLPPAVELE